MKKITIGEELSILKQKLTAAGMESADIDAEQILGKAANLDRSEIFLNMKMELALNEVRRAEKLLKRRLQGEPLQYIMGMTEFFGLPFHVDESVLIPRPETECLVEWALEILSEADKPKILDIGTGSGAIAVALAAHKSEAEIIAFDKSLKALQLAAENSRMNDVREQIQFVVGDLFKEDFIFSVGRNFDLIVCNPPYIATSEIADLQVEIREYEPREALTDGADGLVFCRRLMEVIPKLLKPGGWCLVETAAERAEEALGIMRKTLHNAVLRNDLAGRPRIVGGQWKR